MSSAPSAAAAAAGYKSLVIVCEGVLFKKNRGDNAAGTTTVSEQIAGVFTGARKGWRRRWFVLHGSCLCYFHGSGCPRDGAAPAWSRSLADISGITVEVPPLATAAAGAAPRAAPLAPHSFTLTCADRELVLSAASARDRDRWVNVLTMRLAKARTRTEPTSGGGAAGAARAAERRDSSSGDTPVDVFSRANAGRALHPPDRGGGIGAGLTALDSDGGPSYAGSHVASDFSGLASAVVTVSVAERTVSSGPRHAMMPRAISSASRPRSLTNRGAHVSYATRDSHSDTHDEHTPASRRGSDATASLVATSPVLADMPLPPAAPALFRGSGSRGHALSADEGGAATERSGEGADGSSHQTRRRGGMGPARGPRAPPPPPFRREASAATAAAQEPSVGAEAPARPRSLPKPGAEASPGLSTGLKLSTQSAGFIDTGAHATRGAAADAQTPKLSLQGLTWHAPPFSATLHDSFGGPSTVAGLSHAAGHDSAGRPPIEPVLAARTRMHGGSSALASRSREYSDAQTTGGDSRTVGGGHVAPSMELPPSSVYIYGGGGDASGLFASHVPRAAKLGKLARRRASHDEDTEGTGTGTGTGTAGGGGGGMTLMEAVVEEECVVRRTLTVGDGGGDGGEADEEGETGPVADLPQDFDAAMRRRSTRHHSHAPPAAASSGFSSLRRRSADRRVSDQLAESEAARILAAQAAGGGLPLAAFDEGSGSVGSPERSGSLGSGSAGAAAAAAASTAAALYDRRGSSSVYSASGSYSVADRRGGGGGSTSGGGVLKSWRGSSLDGRSGSVGLDSAAAATAAAAEAGRRGSGGVPSSSAASSGRRSAASGSPRYVRPLAPPMGIPSPTSAAGAAARADRLAAPGAVPTEDGCAVLRAGSLDLAFGAAAEVVGLGVGGNDADGELLQPQEERPRRPSLSSGGARGGVALPLSEGGSPARGSPGSGRAGGALGSHTRRGMTSALRSAGSSTRSMLSMASVPGSVSGRPNPGAAASDAPSAPALHISSPPSSRGDGPGAPLGAGSPPSAASGRDWAPAGGLVVDTGSGTPASTGRSRSDGTPLGTSSRP